MEMKIKPTLLLAIVIFAISFSVVNEFVFADSNTKQLDRHRSAKSDNNVKRAKKFNRSFEVDENSRTIKEEKEKTTREHDIKRAPKSDHKRRIDNKSKRKREIRKQDPSFKKSYRKQRNEKKSKRKHYKSNTDGKKVKRKHNKRVKDNTRKQTRNPKVRPKDAKRQQSRVKEEMPDDNRKIETRQSRRVHEERIKRKHKVKVLEERKRNDHRHKYRPKHKLHNRHKHIYYRTPWYSTWYLAPIQIHYYSVGHRIRHLPRGNIRFFINRALYFYFAGIFYQTHGNEYIVVSAPIGAVVDTLPVGFIAFGANDLDYYYVNNAYYIWDEPRVSYIVVEKPSRAEEIIRQATKGRLYVYPKNGQDEKKQAKDRYKCHQWAISESGFDPTLAERTYDEGGKNNYQRAISACLEGNGYVVK